MIWRYHDSVRPVAVGLTLQSHGAEGAGDVALRSGRRQRGAPDVAHLGGDEKRQHTLTRGNNRNEIGRTNAQHARGRRCSPGTPTCRRRSAAHLDDDAFALVLGVQSSRQEVHEGLREKKGRVRGTKVRFKDRKRPIVTV